MSEEPPDADNELTSLSTVLNRVRPTVVVRRRVYEVARGQLGPSAAGASVQAPAAIVHVAPADEDDDDGPPSSVNVARALASLRGDELRRLEEILTADEDAEAGTAPADAAEVTPDPDPTCAEEPSSARRVPVGETISVVELARRMDVTTHELVTTLVAGGYFSTTAKSVLTRANATTAAWMFGWQVEAVDEAPKATKKSGGRKKR